MYYHGVRYVAKLHVIYFEYLCNTTCFQFDTPRFSTALPKICLSILQYFAVRA